ncbi:protein-L-isoaspartate O-methyltransferase [bacterium]|nr:MAG: protein-L-isoaspartate O-methyltransferase [bacterium]RKZ18020.1 MAG: protein-L-isoaspartate O-methyltransferase [bacterium]
MNVRQIGILIVLLLVPFLLGPGESWKSRRHTMVTEQLIARGISDERVLDAMRTVRRHEFIPEDYRDFSYDDSPVPIGHGQTISQPYIVALMTELLGLQPHHRLFELGTGSGYQAAVASLLVEEVYTIEILTPLAQRARTVLGALGYDNVHVRAGDGWAGWPEAAPFDRIILTAAATDLPQSLLDQLKPGGRLIMPLGAKGAVQELVLVTRSISGEAHVKELLPVRFVPVTRNP